MRIALGTAQFGMPYGVTNTLGKISQENAKLILHYAYSMGIKTIDTATAYGDSETCLGEVGVKNCEVITKLPPIPVGEKKIENWIFNVVGESLDRLKIKSLYGLMLHQPRQIQDSNGAKIIDALLKLQRLSIVKKIGISIYDPYQLKNLFDIHRFDIIQCPLNIVDRRLITSGWLDKLNKLGVEIHVRSVFLQGILLTAPNDLPQKFNKWETLWKNWDSWILKNNTSALEACLSYVLSFSSIHRVVLGVESIDQLSSIVSLYPGKTFNNYPLIESIDPELINPSNWRIN